MIAKSNFRKSADQLQQNIDQLIFGNYILKSLNYVYVYLKPWFLIKSGHYIVPSPSTALSLIKVYKNPDLKIFFLVSPKHTFVLAKIVEPVIFFDSLLFTLNKLILKLSC